METIVFMHKRSSIERVGFVSVTSVQLCLRMCDKHQYYGVYSWILLTELELVLPLFLFTIPLAVLTFSIADFRIVLLCLLLISWCRYEGTTLPGGCEIWE